MSNQRTAKRLSADEVQALKFAAHHPSRDGHRRSDFALAQRAALTSAARTLGDHAFTDGCALGDPSDR